MINTTMIKVIYGDILKYKIRYTVIDKFIICNGFIRSWLNGRIPTTYFIDQK